MDWKNILSQLSGKISKNIGISYIAMGESCQFENVIHTEFINIISKNIKDFVYDKTRINNIDMRINNECAIEFKVIRIENIGVGLLKDIDKLKGFDVSKKYLFVVIFSSKKNIEITELAKIKERIKCDEHTKEIAKKDFIFKRINNWSPKGIIIVFEVENK